MKFIIILPVICVSVFAKVDLNNANLEELMTLHAIDNQRATSIIKYRDEIKCFKSISQLDNAEGIGKYIISKNRKNLYLGDCNLEDNKTTAQ